MRIEFQDKGGKKVILIGMLIGSPKIMSKQCLEDLFRYSGMACETQCHDLCNTILDHHGEAIMISPTLPFRYPRIAWKT
jgi:hypothetical protein